MMARKKKYRNGRIIRNMATVDRLITENRYIMFYQGGSRWVPKHPGVITSMTIHTVRGFIAHKKLRFAVFNNPQQGD